VNKKESPSNKPSYIDLVPEAFLKAWEVKKCSAWSLKRVQNDIDRFVIEIKRYNNIRALLYICTAILLIAVYAFHHNQTRFGELTKLSSFAFVLVFIFAVFYQINSDIHEKVSSFEFKLINDGSWIDSFDDYVKSLLVNEKSDPFTSLTPNSMMARMVSIAQQVLLLEDRIKDLRINLNVDPVALKSAIDELMLLRTKLDTLVRKTRVLSDYFGDAADLTKIYQAAKKALGK
jgi:hypothetical protein